MIALALVLVEAASAQAANFTVNTISDNAPLVGECSVGGADCSLRQAIDAANKTATVDTINVPPGNYRLTIKGANETADQTGDLDVNKAGGSVTINGTAGARATTVDATGLGDRVLQIVKGTATVSGFSITGGSPPLGQGGGIDNNGTLTLMNSTVSGSKTAPGANNDGGGIANPGTGALTLFGDTIVRNSSGEHGGGVDIDAGSASIIDTTITANTAANDGGGVDIDTASTVQFTNDTIYANTGGAGGGVWLPNSSAVSFRNTIVARNALTGGANADCFQSGVAPTDQGHNLDSDGSCFTPANGNGDVKSDPKLGPPQNNGGETDTLALLDGSPAINAGDNAGCPVTDQRATTRPQPTGGRCDIGAYEATPPVAVTNAAANPNPSGGQLNGSVNPTNLATTYHFEYGTSTTYGTSTPIQGAGQDYANHSEGAGIAGLSPHTTYHFRIVATNAVGTSVGADMAFTTPSPPVVLTGPASPISQTSATLTGSVNPEGQVTTYAFQYGVSAAYGQQSAATQLPAGPTAVAVNTALAGLRAGQTYHYRLIASNGTGTTNGTDMTLTTPSARRTTIAVAGFSQRGCVAASASARVSIHDVNPVVSVVVSVDGRQVMRTTRSHFSVRFAARRLRPGRHGLRIVVTDANGTRVVRTLRFGRCAARPVRVPFTG